MPELLQASTAIYSEQLNLCIWNKTNAGMGSFYRSKHELILVFRKGAGPHTNNVALGKYGRHRSNVWDYAGATTFGAERDETLSFHPTVKPVSMVADAIMDCTRRNDHVLDGFCGSGTLLVAAERSGRIGHGIELDPRYVDVSLRRWIRLIGIQPILDETSESFGAVEVRRHREADIVEAAHG